MANGPPGDPGGGAPRTPSGGFSVDGSREGAERGTSATLVSPGGFSPAGRLGDEGEARPPAGGATATLSLGGGAAMLGTVAAGPRSAEDGERGAGSTGRLGVGWGTGEAGALEAAAGGGGAGGDAGAGAAAMTGPDGGAGWRYRGRCRDDRSRRRCRGRCRDDRSRRRCRWRRESQWAILDSRDRARNGGPRGRGRGRGSSGRRSSHSARCRPWRPARGPSLALRELRVRRRRPARQLRLRWRPRHFRGW